MSKRNKKNRPNKISGPSTVAGRTMSPPKDTSIQEELNGIETAIAAGATEEDYAAAEMVVVPENEAAAGEMVKRAAKALAMIELQRKREEESAKKKEEELGFSLQRLREEQEVLDLVRADFQNQQGELEGRLAALSETEIKLNDRQENLIHRELDADNGFAERNRKALAQLEQQAEEIRGQFSSHRAQIAEERIAWENELQERRSALEIELAKKKEAGETALQKLKQSIDTEREAINLENKKLRKNQQGIALEQELIKEDRDAINEKVEMRVARIVESKDGEIKALKERLDAARETSDRLASNLAEREDAERHFGNKQPEEVLAELRGLRKERDQLKELLGSRPSAEASQRLENLERQRELWESDRLDLMAELAEAKEIATRRRINVTEMESLRDQKTSLESSNNLLHEMHRQLREEVEELVTRAEGKNVFPSCSAMDGDERLQKIRPTTDSIDDLQYFADAVRHRMVLDGKSKTELYYSASDVRSLLGGLAMSRLHLLQGISGTGKTSLPLAFARAIGAGNSLIEVQAGWRDRQDLIGHFNSFEKRFYESEFLQALYRARCPLYSSTPFIVVLDEMNLSHPEQYFADLLSALEQEPARRRLVLMTAEVKPSPRLLSEGGSKLPLPENVWFFGTANHDETTKDFADKTYDRAHVMELPRNRESFTRKEYNFQDPISLSALEQAFENAKDKHAQAAKQSYIFLEGKLGNILGKRFRLGWGNRLQRQIEAYVPVFIASGGSLGEASDHILATKILRKIRDRHDNRPEDLIALREHIENGWKSLDPGNNPIRSIDILNQELHRQGHDHE